MKAKDVRNILGVTKKTINNYIREGKLHPNVINSHHYDYDENEVYSLCGKCKERYNITYSRVSQQKQKNDLKLQTQRLYDFAISNGYQIKEQLEDIKSGMSFSERKSFCKLLNKITNYEVKYLIIENKDRLVRFGFELLEVLFKKFGTQIIVASDTENKTYEQELTEDLISIIHYYSTKSYSHRKQLHKIENELKNNANTED